MHFVYGFCDGSALAAVEEYRRLYPDRRTPSRRVYTRIHQTFRDTGCLPSVAVRSEKEVIGTIDTRQNILHVVQRSPRLSTRRMDSGIRASGMQVWRTLRVEDFYLYHDQTVQHPEPGDDAQLMDFCQWIQAHPELLGVILSTDEASFTREGVNNSRNVHTWSQYNPHETRVTNFQRRFSVNVWCGVVDNRLIGPFVFENNLTGNTCEAFLRNELQGLWEDIPLMVRSQMYFQHDGAPPHYTRHVRDYLN